MYIVWSDNVRMTSLFRVQLIDMWDSIQQVALRISLQKPLHFEWSINNYTYLFRKKSNNDID